jgi:hypothetical protein
MSTTVQLGNQTFHYNNTKADHERRTLYFKHQSGATLDAGEQEILDALGVDKSTEEALAPHLADFFRLLPDCSTPTSLTLSKRCELPYYVLWSIMFANKQTVEKRLETQGPRAPSQLNIAAAASIIDELKPTVPKNFVPPGSATQKLVTSTATINKLFTLMLTTPAATSNTTDDSMRRIFTLMLRPVT